MKILPFNKICQFSKSYLNSPKIFSSCFTNFFFFWIFSKLLKFTQHWERERIVPPSMGFAPKFWEWNDWKPKRLPDGSSSLRLFAITLYSLNGLTSLPAVYIFLSKFLDYVSSKLSIFLFRKPGLFSESLDCPSGFLDGLFSHPDCQSV